MLGKLISIAISVFQVPIGVKSNLKCMKFCNACMRVSLIFIERFISFTLIAFEKFISSIFYLVTNNSFVI